MYERLRSRLILIIALLLVIYIFPLQNFINSAAGVFYPRSDLIVSLELANPGVKMLSAEPSNRLLLQVFVRNLSGKPVQGVNVRFFVEQGIGETYPSEAKTDKFGRCIMTYIPPDFRPELFKNNNTDVNITASITRSGASSSARVTLVRVPVVYVHGYQENGGVFDNLKEYLSSRGFESKALNYKSDEGVIPASQELLSFLNQEKISFMSKGIQVNKFDVITHSMGGLVARYYTCSEEYVRNENIRKLIFISVPHKGSPWASAGETYFKDKAIKDLAPDSELLTARLPAMLNKGLNSSIQVGNIIAQYDEVVSPESASLEEWNIKTEVFYIGENNLTMDNIINGSIMEAANHKNLLNNKKVFEEIFSMLNRDLSYPAVRRP